LKIHQESNHFLHCQKLKLLFSISYSVLPSAYCLVTLQFLSSSLSLPLISLGLGFGLGLGLGLGLGFGLGLGLNFGLGLS